jgi:hypothetical protein
MRLKTQAQVGFGIPYEIERPAAVLFGFPSRQVTLPVYVRR